MNIGRQWQGVIVVCGMLLLSLIQPIRGDDKSTDEGIDLTLEDLFNIKITVASKTKESISDAPGVVSVITRDELKRFGGITLADVLKRVPSFLGTANFMTDPSMVAPRGDQITLASTHVLLLINGRPIRGASNSPEYESFPLSVIDHIEVIRGPGSVLYGTQAFSAVINVVTKGPENNTVSVSGMMGEGPGGNIAADLQYKLGDFGVVLAGRYSDKGRWKTQWRGQGNNLLLNEPFRPSKPVDIAIPDNGPGTYAEVSWRDIRAMFSYNQWDNQCYTHPIQWMFENDIRIPGMMPLEGSATASTRMRKYFADLGYKHEFTDWYNASINVTYTRSLMKTRGFPYMAADGYEGLAELTNFFTPLENFNVLVGLVGGVVSGISEAPSLDMIYFKDYTGLNFSGYAQADYRWEWLKILGGLQVNKVRFKDSVDNVDNFDADFNPRAGVMLYPLDHITIKALYSTAYRAPSITELYINGGGINGKMIRREDPLFTTWDHEYDLKPEKVNTYDLGAGYQDDKVQFGINGFYSHMKNIISLIIDKTRYSNNTYDNLNEISIFGLECEGKYYLSKSLLFVGSFLYQQSRDETTGDANAAPFPNFSAKGGLSYQAEFGLTLSAFNTFHQSVDPKYFDIYGNKTTKHFNMANLHCGYDLNKLFKIPSAKEFSLVLNIDNLLNEEVWLTMQAQQEPGTVPYNRGRTIYGGFKVAF